MRLVAIESEAGQVNPAGSLITLPLVSRSTSTFVVAHS